MAAEVPITSADLPKTCPSDASGSQGSTFHRSDDWVGLDVKEADGVRQPAHGVRSDHVHSHSSQRSTNVHT